MKETPSSSLLGRYSAFSFSEAVCCNQGARETRDVAAWRWQGGHHCDGFMVVSGSEDRFFRGFKVLKYDVL